MGSMGGQDTLALSLAHRWVAGPAVKLSQGAFGILGGGTLEPIALAAEVKWAGGSSWKNIPLPCHTHPRAWNWPWRELLAPPSAAPGWCVEAADELCDLLPSFTCLLRERDTGRTGVSFGLMMPAEAAKAVVVAVGGCQWRDTVQAGPRCRHPTTPEGSRIFVGEKSVFRVAD